MRKEALTATDGFIALRATLRFELRVLRQKHDAHAAGAEKFQDSILAEVAYFARSSRRRQEIIHLLGIFVDGGHAGFRVRTPGARVSAWTMLTPP